MCQSAKLCNMQSRGGCQQCLFLRSLPAAGHLCGPGEPAGHVPGHLWTAATLRGVLLQASSVRQNGNQTRGQCQIQPGRGKWSWPWNCLVLSNLFLFTVCFIIFYVWWCTHVTLIFSAILNKIIPPLWCSWSANPPVCSHSYCGLSWDWNVPLAPPISSPMIFLPHIPSLVLHLAGSMPKCFATFQFKQFKLNLNGTLWSSSKLLCLQNHEQIISQE